MIHFMESISQCITAASPARTVWMSFSRGNDLSHKRFLPTVPALLQFIIICPRKIFISVKGLDWVSRESGLALMRMTAAVSFTLCGVDRRENRKDVSGSTARVAPATRVNNSGNNNQGCLFFPKLSVSMTDLFWRLFLFWHISGGLTVTAPCQRVVCTLTSCLPPVLWWSRQAAEGSRDTTPRLCLTFSEMSYFW